MSGSFSGCSAIYGFASSASCSAVTGENAIRLTGAFPTVDFLLIFSVNGVSNPSFEKNFYIFVASYKSTGEIIEFSGATNFTFRTTPGVLACTLTNLGSTVVAEYTDISVSFTATNEVEQTGYFGLGMAKWNSGTQTIGLEASAMKYSATDFNVSQQGYTVPCSSTDHPSLACIFQVAAVTTLEQISSQRDVLKISGLSKAITAGTTFTFMTTDSRFRNPPSTKTVSTFVADSHRGDGSAIDQKLTGISYKVATAATILAN